MAAVVAAAERHISVGNEAFHRQDFEAAREAYNVAFYDLRAAPNSVEGKIAAQVRCGNNLTVVLFKLKRFDEARMVCESVLEVAPQGDGRIKALKNLGKVCASNPAADDESIQHAHEAFEEIIRCGSEAQQQEAQRELEKLQVRHSGRLSQSLPEPPELERMMREHVAAEEVARNHRREHEVAEAVAKESPKRAKKNKKKAKQPTTDTTVSQSVPEDDRHLYNSFGECIQRPPDERSSDDGEAELRDRRKKKERRKRTKQLTQEVSCSL